MYHAIETSQQIAAVQERSADARRLREINARSRDEVLALAPDDICLFLPHCLRSLECPAKTDQDGVRCRRCGRCTVGTLVTAAEAVGVRAFCVPGGSLVETLVRKTRPKALVGVACVKELNMALEMLRGRGFLIQAFPLDRDGCVDTRVSPEPVLELLAAVGQGKRSSEGSGKMHPESPETEVPGARGTAGPTPAGDAWSGVIPQRFDHDTLARLCGDTAYAYDTVGPSKTIAEPIWDFLSRGGKGKRAELFCLILRAFGRDEARYRDFMLIPELSHNGTLIIDDIEDGSSHRRGRPCVHHLYGTDVAVNAGNALYFLPLLPVFRRDTDIPDARRNEILHLYVQGMVRLHFGQGMDIAWHRGLLNRREICEEKYLQMCGLKTGSLYWMSARIAAVLAEVPDAAAAKLGEFADAIGVGFQIKDDLLDIQGGRFATGKGGPGRDITEGKITLMVIHALRDAPEHDAARLEEILSLHTEDPERIGEAISILERCGAPAYARHRAEAIVRQAYSEVEPLIPAGPSKERVWAFAASLLERDM